MLISLRIAAIISLLFAAGHTSGGRSSWSPAGDTATLAAMRDFHMHVQGVTRSYYDFYVGFGYSLSVYMALQAVLLWLLAGLAKRHSELARPLVLAMLVASVANAILTWKFIAPVPALFSFAITAAIAAGYFLSLRNNERATFTRR